MQVWVGLVATVLTCGAGCANGDAASMASRYDRTLPADPIAGTLQCEIAAAARPLPRDLRESSGLARSAHDASLFWTHNDAGHGPVLFAFDTDGRIAGRMVISGAQSVDWEDLEAVPCGAGSCLLIGDIGDNDGARSHITVYRVREPVLGGTGMEDAGMEDAGPRLGAAAAEVPAEAFHAQYPDGARDAEALFVDHSGGMYIVTKGRHGAVVLYRWPAPLQAGERVVLEPVRALFPTPATGRDRVTAASATPDGRWVAVRTYRTLYLYRAAELIGTNAGGASAAGVDAAGASTAGADATAGARPFTFDLAPLGEPQGEGVAIADDGTVWLTSESGGPGQAPRWSQLRCTLPD